MWEGLLSQATLVGGAEKRSAFNSRRDAFARNRGLMSETAEVPWDIQLKGKAGSLLKRLYDQGPSTMAGRMMPAHPPPTSVAASMLQHAQDIGLNPRAPVGPRAWKRTVHEAVRGARSARLTALSQAACPARAWPPWRCSVHGQCHPCRPGGCMVKVGACLWHPG